MDQARCTYLELVGTAADACSIPAGDLRVPGTPDQQRLAPAPASSVPLRGPGVVAGERVGGVSQGGATDGRTERRRNRDPTDHHHQQNPAQPAQHGIDLVQRTHELQCNTLTQRSRQHPNMRPGDRRVEHECVGVAACHRERLCCHRHLYRAATGSRRFPRPADKLQVAARAAKRRRRNNRQPRHPFRQRGSARQLEISREALDHRHALPQTRINLAAQLSTHNEVDAHGRDQHGKRDSTGRRQRQPAAETHASLSA